MLREAAVRHYGSRAELASVLDITEQAISLWGPLVPPLPAAELYQLTCGELPFDPTLYPENSPRAQVAFRLQRLMSSAYKWRRRRAAHC